MKANGFTLLEVLIALVIFSFGLLALAALMAKGLQYNTSALHRSYASAQAYDIADRMRANRLGITAGNYDSISGVGSDPGCIATGCTPAQMAQYDGWAWNSANAALLPSGSGSVTTNGTTYTITVTWDDDRDGPPLDNFVFQLQP
ncbi:MAG: type IV pilus modification protein PilV [Arenicellales bacterium]|nr:type IV pilus modification protein PilV [Arenicellales bacterium]